MSIIRKVQRDTFTVIDNEPLRDARLSWKATGLLAYLLSLPDGWEVKGRELANRKTDGRDSVFAGMKELEELGYIERVSERAANGTLRTVTIVREKPVSPGQTESGLSESGSTESGEPGPLVKTQQGSTQGGKTHQSQDLAARERDGIYETLFALAAGLPYTLENRKVLTKASASALNTAVRDVKATGVTEAQLVDAIRQWPTIFDNATCTPTAVAKWLPQLRAAAERGIVTRGGGRPSDDELASEVVRRRRDRGGDEDVTLARG